MEALRYCQNVTAESYSGHPKESAAELVTLFLQSTMEMKFWKTQLDASGNGYLALGSLE